MALPPNPFPRRVTQLGCASVSPAVEWGYLCLLCKAFCRQEHPHVQEGSQEERHRRLASY